ncbi:putative transporter C36.02c [Golovinomyces cichoracearum]|uniref:Putative transporter C36.02c n=1 Tax=Golovinomyces cichoracearum TaxID=62708 RepID=A0A420JAY0_9PEZI|nr:putative transporter C36.02c [Golovinomyces cichoracearum]
MDAADQIIAVGEYDASHPQSPSSSSTPMQNESDIGHMSISSTATATGFPIISSVQFKKPYENDLERNANISINNQNLTPCYSRSSNDNNMKTQERESDYKSSHEINYVRCSTPQSDPQHHIVRFEGPDDPTFAQNWPARKKYLTTLMLSLTTMVSVFTSSVFSTAISKIMSKYNISQEIGSLGVSLYVLGFAFGPMIWAPLSELKGRRLIIVWPLLGFTIFQVGVAAAKDLQTIMICRFWGGIFGAAPISTVAGIFADIYDNGTRGVAMIAYSMTVFAAPLISQFVGGFIVQSSPEWTWIEWLAAMLGFISFIFTLIFLEETYAPAILVTKANKMRHKTQNWAIHAKQEEIEVDLRQLFLNYFTRPIRMIFKEPIILFISLYMSFVYGILYLFLTAYPIVFQRIHGMSQGVGGLPFLGMILGMIMAGSYLIILQPSYNRKLAKNNNINDPQWRLPPMVVGGIAFAVGLFWFGWSGYTASIHWIVPTLSGISSGFGLLIIFVQCQNYLIDAYLMFTASVVAAHTLLRSLAGAGFPIFAPALFRSCLGIKWGCTLLGCVATFLIPIPIIFSIYGTRLQARSSFNIRFDEKCSP